MAIAMGDAFGWRGKSWALVRHRRANPSGAEEFLGGQV